MNAYKCLKCGYTIQRNLCPDVCPMCKKDKPEFEVVPTYYPPSSTPSVARLEKELHLSPEQAAAVKKLAKRGPEARRGEHISHAIMEWMGELAKLIENPNGVESCHPEKEWLYYVNAGDTYATTLIYDSRGQGKIRVACWGDHFGA